MMMSFFKNKIKNSTGSFFFLSNYPQTAINATGINEVLNREKLYDLNSITFTSREREKNVFLSITFIIFFFLPQASS